ncbi:MAG: amidohydrolase, partial [Chloroflexota bacterium]
MHSMYLKNATLITMNAERHYVEQGALLIENGVITAIGRSADVTPPPDAERIDLGGRMVLPG